MRVEISDGRIVGDNGTEWHYKKAADTFKGFSQLLEEDRNARRKGKPPILSDRERQIALDEARELWGALNTKDESGKFMARITSTPQGRELLAKAKTVMDEGAKNYSVKEFTGTPFKQERYRGKVTAIYPTGPAKMVGVAGLLSVAGDLLLLHEVGKAFASEDPAAALNEILCSFGSPSCSGPVGRDGVNSYYRNEDGDVFAVPNA